MKQVISPTLYQRLPRNFGGKGLLSNAQGAQFTCSQPTRPAVQAKPKDASSNSGGLCSTRNHIRVGHVQGYAPPSLFPQFLEVLLRQKLKIYND